MKVKASKCFYDATESVLRRPTDTFDVTKERAEVLAEKGLIEALKKTSSKENIKE
jgi:hypothetical protein